MISDIDGYMCNADPCVAEDQVKQWYPMDTQERFHKVKEETFIVVWGELISTLEGRERVLLPGDTLLVPPGAWHSFRSEKGCIFEEISTTAIPGDSVYRDENINNLSSSERKTIVDYWGRFQINEQLRDSKLPLNVRKFKSKK